MGDLSLLGFAALMTEKIGELVAGDHEILEQSAQVVETEAKRVIGTFDYGWSPLAPSTLARKAANTPLLETGEMRDSIQHNADLREAHIGSNSDKAVWQELGTIHIPPRSFLKGALVHKADEIVEIAGTRVRAVLSGDHVFGPFKP